MILCFLVTCKLTASIPVDAGPDARNNIVKEFAGNPDVAFGDVNLATDRVVGKYSPGAGGWPTIRYFNKATGYEGRAFHQLSFQLN